MAGSVELFKFCSQYHTTNNCEVFVKLRFFATAFEVYSSNFVIVNFSCLIIAII